MYHLREILIALCMPLYDIDYLNPFNFGHRLWVIHNETDCYAVKAPIMDSAKFINKYWKYEILDPWSCRNPPLITDPDYIKWLIYEEEKRRYHKV